MITAFLKNHRQSSRKVRLVTDAIKGKSASAALIALKNMPKRAADPVLKVLNSALSNAKHNNSLDADALMVKTAEVNEGPTMKRWLPKAHGRATPIRKRTSRILIGLEEVAAPKKKAAKKTEEKKVEKKAPAKKKPAAKKVTKKADK